jgi:hypothetical protein
MAALFAAMPASGWKPLSYQGPVCRAWFYRNACDSNDWIPHPLCAWFPSQVPQEVRNDNHGHRAETRSRLKPGLRTKSTPANTAEWHPSS